MSGTLFVVATPIGNLEDLTFRALRTLKEADLIAAEDTRRTSKLLAHYAISRPLVSLREHNEARESAKLVVRLKAGQNIALVSDAGTPAVADPGARLVRAARAEGIKVLPIPGASAITAAISVSGLETTEFTFKGFPPAARIARRQWLDELNAIDTAIVFFEAPHRVAETISDAEQILVERQIHIFREITKINEEYVIRPILSGDSALQLVELGEFTVVVGPRSSERSNKAIDQVSAAKLFNLISVSGLVDESNVVPSIATALGVDVQAAMKAVKKGKILVKRQNE